MAIDLDDPQWTAYVLGELDATERTAIEQQLAASPAARQLVASLRQTITLVEGELRAEPVPATASVQVVGSPSTDQRSENHRAENNSVENHRPTVVGHPGRRWRWSERFPAIAASLVFIGAIIGGLVIPARHGGQSSGRRIEIAAKDGRAAADSSVSREEIADSPAVVQLDVPTDFSIAEPTCELAEAETEGMQPDALMTDTPRIRATDDLAVDSSDIAGLGGSGPQGLAIQAAPVNRYSKVESDPLGEGRTRGLEYSSDGERFGIASQGAETGRDANEESARHGAGRPSPAPGLAAPVQNARPNSFGYAQEAAPGAAPLDATAKAGGYNNSPVIRPDRSNLSAANAEQRSATPLASAGKPVSGGVAGYAAPSPGGPGQPGTPEGFGGGGGYAVSDLRQPLANRSQSMDSEAYEPVVDNPFKSVTENPLSTFSIDVDTASYSIVRRYLQQNHQLPPCSAVRIEELVNYFRYAYPQPEGKQPFSVNMEIASCPWNAEHRLVRVGLKGREVAREQRPLSNLVFLIDVSGSMQDPNKLPLVKDSLRLLTEQLGENDRVAIVVYAGNSGLVLPSTSGIDKQKIMQAIDRLEAGGSTNGGQGIQLAYETCLSHFIKGGTNRVILATDGDFNVGITDRGELIRLVEQRAASGVALTTLGYGMGNLKDATLEQLADKGNGNYAYIDGIREARKVLVEQLSGTLVTIAKDVKIQIEFNPAQVASFRLIGYENRILRHEDFNNDKKDAGEIGAGHTVTALYELVPVAEGGKGTDRPAVDPLKYQQPKAVAVDANASGELLTLKLRYKEPEAETSQLLEYPLRESGQRWAQASPDFKFASSVALFGMLLRHSPYGTATYAAAIELAQEGRGSDLDGYRAEFIEMMRQASDMTH